MEGLVLAYAVFLSTFHLFCEKMPICIRRSHDVFLSYGGGSLLAIIFLVFLPEAVHYTPTIIVYPLMLLGFVVFLVSEKYLYQHVKDPELLDEELYHLHLIGFFVDHFIKGFILVTIILLEPVLGLLTAIPFFINTLSSSIVLDEVHKFTGRRSDKLVLSSSIVLGTLTGIFFDMTPYIERSIIAFISGMMIFVVSRDVLPKDKEGRPTYFLLGVFTIFLIWIALEYVLV